MKAIPETCCGTKFDIYVCISDASFLIGPSDGKDYVYDFPTLCSLNNEYWNTNGIPIYWWLNGCLIKIAGTRDFNFQSLSFYNSIQDSITQ